MPILKEHKISFATQLIEKSKRNGKRHTIFGDTDYPKSLYIGAWKNDKKEGVGLEITRHRFKYQGLWLNGLRHGFGRLDKLRKKALPEKKYAGNWCQGKKHGYGIFWYKDGYYKGNFKNDLRHGFGKMFWNDGRCYVGNWRNDLFHGQGTFITCNGNEYNGNFVEGKKEGHGIFYHKNTGQIQPGFWINDICKFGEIEDCCFRQFCLYPTPYPIPEFI